MEGNIKPSNRLAIDILFTLFMQAILIGFVEGIRKNIEFYLNSRSKIKPQYGLRSLICNFRKKQKKRIFAPVIRNGYHKVLQKIQGWCMELFQVNGLLKSMCFK
jgi:hypothetical protein